MSSASPPSRCANAREGVGQGDGKLEQSGERKITGGDQRRERLPLDELHREEADSVHIFHGVKGDDIRVIQSCDGARRPRISYVPRRVPDWKGSLIYLGNAPGVCTEDRGG